MSLPPIGRIPSPAAVAPSRTAPQPGFVVALPEMTAGRLAMPSVAQAVPVGVISLLALQENATAGTGDREARQHAHQLLAALAELQRALLSEGGGDALQRLSMLTDTVSLTSDPALAQAVASIRLRARLELARVASAPERRPRGVA